MKTSTRRLIYALFVLSGVSFLFFVIVMKDSFVSRLLFQPFASWTDHKSDSALYHPADPDNLWVRISEEILIRRLAFYDTRNSSHITVVFNCMYNDSYDISTVKDPLYATLYYPQWQDPICVTLEYWVASYARYYRVENHEIWVNYLLRTIIDLSFDLEVPVYATISLDPNCTESSVSIPIQSNETDRVYTYGVCLHKSIYNMTEPQEILQWVELNLALGVEIMTIYLQYVPESFYTVLFPYIKKGLVEVLDWGLKPPVIPEYTKFWGQTGVINECIYRNLYRVKYLGLYDLDEFFVPQKHHTIPEMITAIEEEEEANTTRASSYVIYNAFFYHRNQTLPQLEMTTNKNCPQMKWPRYYTYTVRSQRPASQHRFHKLLVKPNLVISAWTHWVNKCMEGHTLEYRIPVDMALTQHYRFPEKKPLTEDFMTSFTISKYFNQTYQGISRRLCKKQ